MCGLIALPRIRRTLVEPVLGTSTKMHYVLMGDHGLFARLRTFKIIPFVDESDCSDFRPASCHHPAFDPAIRTDLAGSSVPLSYSLSTTPRSGLGTRGICRVAPEIAATVLRLLQDIEDEEWVYWCSDDKYPIHFIVEKVTELLQYVLTTPEISGLLFCRAPYSSGSTRPGVAFASTRYPGRRYPARAQRMVSNLDPSVPQSKGASFAFSQLPLKIPSAKALDGLKDQIRSRTNITCLSPSKTLRSLAKAPSEESLPGIASSIRQTDIELPEWFQRSNGEWVTMGRLPEDTLWQRFRRWLSRAAVSNASPARTCRFLMRGGF